MNTHKTDAQQRQTVLSNTNCTFPFTIGIREFATLRPSRGRTAEEKRTVEPVPCGTAVRERMSLRKVIILSKKKHGECATRRCKVSERCEYEYHGTLYKNVCVLVYM